MDSTCLVWLQCPTAQKECDNTICSAYFEPLSGPKFDFSHLEMVFVITDCKMAKQKSVNLKLTYT